MHFLIHFIVIGLKEFTQNPRGPQAAQIIQVPGSKELLKFLPQSPLSAVVEHRSSVQTEGHSEYLCVFKDFSLLPCTGLSLATELLLQDLLLFLPSLPPAAHGICSSACPGQ